MSFLNKETAADDLHIIRSKLYCLAGKLRIKMLKVLLRGHVRFVRRDDLLGVE